MRKKAKPVPDRFFGTAELKKIIADMSEALDVELDGVALAAPQIGVSYRIFIARIDRAMPPPLKEGAPARPAEVAVFINPEIVKTSRKREKRDEGCLSVRGIYGSTNRHERATIKARGVDGKHFQRGAGGVLAQIFEHEIDHLNGILFIDHAKNLIKVEIVADNDA